jgi:hypothetical protein
MQALQKSTTKQCGGSGSGWHTFEVMKETVLDFMQHVSLVDAIVHTKMGAREHLLQREMSRAISKQTKRFDDQSHAFNMCND